jgi:hypothetical protein
MPLNCQKFLLKDLLTLEVGEEYDRLRCLRAEAAIE